MQKLPEKLSDLIEVALEDCRKVELRNDADWNMGHWVISSKVNADCLVCVAGAVMIERLNALKTENYIECGTVCPGDGYYDTYTISRLRALNMARVGHVNEALFRIDWSAQWQEKYESFRNEWPKNLTGPHCGEVWYDKMRDMVTMLREDGL